MNRIIITPSHHPNRPSCRVCGRKFEYGESANTYQSGSKTMYQCDRCDGKNLVVYPLKMRTKR